MIFPDFLNRKTAAVGEGGEGTHAHTNAFENGGGGGTYSDNYSDYSYYSDNYSDYYSDYSYSAAAGSRAMKVDRGIGGITLIRN